jgi:nucleoside-diphosphate-sugar epimerase
MRIVVTGAGGFVGSALCNSLAAEGHQIIALSRHADDRTRLDDASALTSCFNGADAIVHLAARAHVIDDRAADRLLEFRKVNVEGTRCVASAAVAAGVRRLVFASSIGVLGNATRNESFSEASEPAPVEPYAISKWEAEQILRDVERRDGLEVTIVRPVLVYGPNVRGNFLRLLRLVSSERPLPLGSIRNRRSFIGVANLCDLLSRCVTQREAAGRTFVAADGDISTPDLLRLLASSMGRRSHIFSFPLLPLSMGAALLGKRAEFLRLAGNLTVDASLAKHLLGWLPAKTLQQGVSEMGAWYASLQRS